MLVTIENDQRHYGLSEGYRRPVEFVKLSILCDNYSAAAAKDENRTGASSTPSSEFSAEHGYSVWIETPHHKILFDTGKTDVFMHNAETLGLDLMEADMAILSHGHYDHGGGLLHVFPGIPRLLLHPHALQVRYSMHPGEVRPVHLPATVREKLEEWRGSGQGPEMEFVLSPRWIAPGVGVTGSIPRKTMFEDTGGSFYLDPHARIPDALHDDMAIWFWTPAGLVILTGCAHSGIVNTIEHILQFTGIQKIRAVLGGFHLNQASEERLRKTANYFKQLSNLQLFPSHCTGDDSIEYLTQNSGAELTRGYAGLQFSF